MLNNKVFIEGCVLIASSLGIELQSEYTDIVYGIIKKDFDDDDFRKAVVQILREEDLYYKMPTVRTFLKYATNKQPTRIEIENFGKNAFLNKVSAYLAKNYVSLEEKEEFLNNLTNIEYRALLVYGGISEIWKRVHNEDYPVSTGRILKELGDFYSENVNADNISKRILSIDKRNEGMKKLGDLLNVS